ncbi:uncharacterized protein LOC117190846 [Drosophila miranda]|uniref:uncharacterized protein LOC117190846 n=1 Tax=Drosophila miranda TaxID=7229 RepID=UPI00143F859D|nr:uncharacterized protein LOC117190846 [Drosophila miranda]
MYDSKGNLIAISSIFGWVITALMTPQASNAFSLTTTLDIDASLQKFWELENVDCTTKLEPEDEQVEKHFLTTHTRDANGKYIVELPFHTTHPEFGDTLQGALQRFKMVERRLQQNEQLRVQYIHFMREYQTLGHMRQLPTEEITSGQHFYMPHHPVLGRKLRVVFDGSFRDANETGIQNEVKTNCLSTLAESQLDNPLEELIARVSSWWKLVHTIGYVLRFIQRTKHPSRDRSSQSLTFHEIRTARILCLRYAQTCFQDDYQLLLAKKPLRSRSQLLKLSPIIDKDNLLRVGGRLHHSQLPEEAKHPVLLPKTHCITKLILEHEHRVNLHPGVSALFVIVRQRFWIFGARNLVRKITHECLACFRQRQHTSQQ